MTDPDLASLRAAVAMADKIIDLVATRAPESVRSRDRNDQFLILAFGRALRCFRSARDLAAVHAEADDVYVLTRALMVVSLQSLWVAAPDDAVERLRRSRAIELAALLHLRTQGRSMERLGMDPGVRVGTFDVRIAELELAGAGRVPPDEVIAREVGFEQLYARAYRSASDSAHYSLYTALHGFDVSGIDGPIESFDGLRIRFLDGDPKRAAEALVLASLVYVGFLERSEPVVPHGTFESAKEILEAHVRAQQESA